MLWAMRKIATAARVTRMMLPASTVAPEKRTSPGRRRARISAVALMVRNPPGKAEEQTERTEPAGSDHMVSRPAGRPAGELLDGRQGVRHLARELVGQRSGTRRGRRLLLAVGARDVSDVGLHQVALGCVGVLLADDRVADEDERVVARVRRGAVEGDRDVVRVTAVDERRIVDDGRRG